jgi:hypothetical protein
LHSWMGPPVPPRRATAAVVARAAGVMAARAVVAGEHAVIVMGAAGAMAVTVAVGATAAMLAQVPRQSPPRRAHHV